MLINANGTTNIDVDAGKEYVISAAGTFGGGTLVPKWTDGFNDVTVQGPAGDIAMTTGAAYVFVSPAEMMKLVLTGASNPSITVNLVARVR